MQRNHSGAVFATGPHKVTRIKVLLENKLDHLKVPLITSVFHRGIILTCASQFHRWTKNSCFPIFVILVVRYTELSM